MAGRFRMNEGDWVCAEPQCGNVNFARRTSCNRCGKEKTECSKKKKLGTEIGKVAAEKSRGLFSADDWQCSKCGNVNWARRQQCNMCNAPKYGEVEERTGYGGGYNERENVEYIEREESDGEYDEFGRKKKKFRGAGDEPDKKPEEKPRKQPEPQQPPKVEDDEEDEDEDDDDGDLSKYDLSGWGDSNDGQNEDDNKEKRSSSSSSSSRSRSRSPANSPRKRKRESHSRSRSRSSSSDSRSGYSSKRYRSSRSRSHSRSNSASQDRSRSNSSDRK